MVFFKRDNVNKMEIERKDFKIILQKYMGG